MEQVETEGLVLSLRPYKERDQLIKIFTEKYGKAMFLVKRAATPQYMHKSALQLGAGATYIMRIHEDGLSFINSVKERFAFSHIQQDYEVYPYMTYMFTLVDYALEDHDSDPLLYGVLKQALQLMDKGYDASVIAAIFAVQLLMRFGVHPIWEACTLCQEQALEVPFDYSEQDNGVICYRHFSERPYRYHATPRALYFVRQFQYVTFETLEKIQLSQETKQEIWALIDHLYDSYVGIHFKERTYFKTDKHLEHLAQTLRQKRIDKKS